MTVSAGRTNHVVPSIATFGRMAGAIAAVMATTAFLTLVDADLAVAVAVLLLVVFCASTLGYASGLVAAGTAFAALNYYFTPPRHSFSVDRADDVVALLVFVAIAVLVATAVDRIKELREEHVRSEIDRSRAGFLTAITHDLRTPLATIKASTGALLISRSQLDESGRRELLQLAYGESMRLERLVTNALEVGRIRAGALQPRPAALGAADIVRAAVERLGPLTKGRSIELAIRDDTPAVWADPGMVARAVSNLLENALGHGGTTCPIEICADAVDARLEVRVIDHGTGIPVADRHRIFEEFVRLDDSGSGSGLGLAIVRALVEANGGQVRCEETPGGGSTFAMILPTSDGEKR